MWRLKSIHANNLCSFLELSYSPKQGEATLIFGNNLDSDSQNSNGSGKSALIEAIAIALTGDPLRKVNIDEIINDTKDEATISAVLSNDISGVQMTINRKLSRKQPQVIQILLQTGPYDTDVEDVSQATVADYNKYILDQLGLTKDDIFANFILTARKYKSFLASSDKDKKELINRFSNGILVDRSIEKLKQDIEPVLLKWSEAEKQVALCTGRVDALAAEIEKTINEAEDRKASNESRIHNWQLLIAGKRSEIRDANASIKEIEKSLDSLDELDDIMQTLESSDKDEVESLSIIRHHFSQNHIALCTDYQREIELLDSQLEMAEKEVNYASGNINKLKSALDLAEQDYSTGKENFNKQSKDLDTRKRNCESAIKELYNSVQECQSNLDKYRQEQVKQRKEAAQLEQMLAGIITCPKCKHEFFLNASESVSDLRESLKEVKRTIEKIAESITQYETEYQKVIAEGKVQRQVEQDLDKEELSIQKTLSNLNRKVQESRQEYIKCESQIEQAQTRLSTIHNKLNHIRKRMFDEVFDTIDDAYKKREAKIKSLGETIKVAEGSIDTYEKAILEAQKVNDDEIIESFKSSRKQYENQLSEATKTKNEIESQLTELQAQESTFVEFKTYLANTKINAISQITNSFLETIGSDIRVALSGYTILKSGKVRDKISVSLLRDGIDCGSFEKFSAGERVRVELASILSMNKLTNLNCEEGKGLDLLIADEVLDSADEQGLASVFKALNQTQITSLVVSHGRIAESYPNRILVTKSNGISFIDEQTN